MRRPRDLIRRLALLTPVAGLAITALGWEGPALGTEDPFVRMAVQRPANPAPDLALPSLDGRTVRIRYLQGKVVLLGFFTTT